MNQPMRLAPAPSKPVPLGGARTHTLHPGDVVCAGDGDRLETLLGSCVAIVMTDPRRTVGVMCHIVHSGRPVPGMPATTAYAEVALDKMFSLLRARAINPAMCEAYVYGGGNMFPHLYNQRSVGDQNADWALAALAHEGVRVLIEDVGGNTYRRLSWTIGPGHPQVVAVAV